MLEGVARRSDHRPNIGKQRLMPRPVAEVGRDRRCDRFRLLLYGVAQFCDIRLPRGKRWRPCLHKVLALEGQEIRGL